MQQPLSNRWLNPDLLQRPAIASLAQEAALQRAGDAARAAVATAGFRGELTDTLWLREVSTDAAQGYGRQPRRDRQFLMLLAASLLLLGSAAFSYVAWSETLRAPGASADISSAAVALQHTVAPTVVVDSGQREAVLNLRQENSRLRARLDTLEASLRQAR